MSVHDILSGKDDTQTMVDAFVFYENELEQAKEEVKIYGSYQKQSASLPGYMEYRFRQLQEVEAILEYLNIKKDKAHHIAFKKFFEGYNKTLSSREADKYANADKDVISLLMLINQITLIRNKYLGITKGLEAKHYQLTNLVKLKVAGMEDYFIEAK